MPPTHRPGHHPPRAWRHRVLTAHRPPGKPWPPKSTVDRGPEGTVRGALRGRWAGAPDSAGSPSAGPASTLPGEPRPTPDVSLRLPYAAADTGPQAPLHPEPPAPRAPCPASPLHREPAAPQGTAARLTGRGWGLRIAGSLLPSAHCAWPAPASASAGLPRWPRALCSRGPSPRRAEAGSCPGRPAGLFHGAVPDAHQG